MIKYNKSYNTKFILYYMKKEVLLVLFSFVFLINIFIISASCNETQININIATKEELDKIIWVGPSTADKIISYRQTNPFDSVDELINVSGIGETKLNDIKSQGFACVNESQEQNNSTDEKMSKENNSNENVTNEEDINNSQDYNNEKINEKNEEPITESIITKSITSNIIKLAPKNIKSEESKGILNKNNLAIYSFIAFCILLGFLFLIKRRRHKNELA